MHVWIVEYHGWDQWQPTMFPHFRSREAARRQVRQVLSQTFASGTEHIEYRVRKYERKGK